MRTDTHLHTIFFNHPAWLFQLLGKPDPGPCDVDSVHLKQLASSPDSRITPKNPELPLWVVEFQFVNGGDNILSRATLSMNLAQRHYHLRHPDPAIRRAGLTGRLRPVCGLAILGPGVKTEPAEPWEKVVEIYQFETLLSAFTAAHPGHPVAHLFFPLLEPDLEKVDQEAKVHYRALAECEKRGEIEPDLLKVFADWFNQRHPEKLWEEIGMILLEDLTPLEETASWKQASARGQEIGEARGEAKGKEIGKEAGERELLQRQLKAKFGPLPRTMRTACASLTYDQARELALDFLIMADIGELEQWLKNKKAKAPKKRR